MAQNRPKRLSDVLIRSGIPKEVKAPVRPEKFTGVHEGQLGKAVGMSQFGINHVVLEPGMWSALRHWHETEDEFVYVLSGELALVDDDGRHRMEAGSFVGFPAGEANAHHLVNDTDAPAAYIVVGSRRKHDTVHYPDDDLGPISR